MRQQQQQAEEAIRALLTDGQKSYSAKNYSTAVHSFTKAINLLHRGLKIDRLQILDLRIGAYVKLSRLNSALTDAKSMVRLGRSDARGYIRCAQLARLTENHGEAIKWYLQGLKNVPESDRMYSYIKVQMSKCKELKRKRAVLSKPQDPMLSFPVEVIEIILSYFEYREQIAILRVSRSWRAVVSRTQVVSETINVSGSRKRITYPMMRATLRRLKKSPKSLFLNGLADGALRLLIQHLPRWLSHHNLQDIETNDPRIQEVIQKHCSNHLQELRLGVEADLYSHSVYTILKSYPQLSSARFEISNNSSVPRNSWLSFDHSAIKRLEMKGRGPADIVFPGEVLDRMPNLTELSCQKLHIVELDEDDSTDHDHLRNLRNLQVVDFSDSTVEVAFALPSSLQVLRLHGSILKFSNSFPKMSQLRVLDIRKCVYSQRMIENICNSGGLTSISHLLFNLDYLIDVCGADLFDRLVDGGWFGAVRYLHIISQRLHDKGPQHFISKCPMLETLVLENAAITGIFIRDILLAPASRVTKISLKDCLKVSADIVEWAQQRGVEIEIKKTPEQTFGGRRLY